MTVRRRTFASRIPPLAAWGIAAVAALGVSPARAQDVLGDAGIKGAGSTFAYPVLSRWSREYRQWLARGGAFPTENGGLDDPPASSALDYEPVGSLAGTLRVKDRAVDFGASDMPLTSAELAALGLCQFPLVIGGVVVVVNLDGLGASDLRLTGPLLADIFLGRIDRWSDPRIKAQNLSLKLPEAAITVVRREDGSGTTFNFTDYLSQVSPEWKLKAGSGLLIAWPTGKAAKGNEGAARAVQAARNAIGYVEYGQATKLGLRHALLQNRAGTFVRPDGASFQAAAASADWGRASDFHLLLTNTAGRGAYPIAATVFALMRRSAPRGRTSAALDFFRWSLEHGSAAATQLGYVPLPPALVKQVFRYWATTFKSGS
jgi:phosphate transport system substrate-binding protein